MDFRTRALMLAWSPFSPQSMGLARDLGIPCHLIHYLAYQRPWITPVKYPLQAAATLRLLMQARPSVVIVQNIPFVAPLVATLYARATGAGVIMDSHCHEFVHPRWRWSRPLLKPLVQRAVLNILPDPQLVDLVQSWGGRTVLARYRPSDIPALGARRPADQFTAMNVSTFTYDEPIAEVLGAARLVPDARFAITGDTRRARPEWLRDAPPNVEFTGFLRGEAFYRRLWDADVLLTLTTMELSILAATREAIELAQPVILSDWPAQRDWLGAAPVYVPNTAEGIAAGVRRAREHAPALRAAMQTLRTQQVGEWRQALRLIDELVDGVWQGARRTAPAAAIAS